MRGRRIPEETRQRVVEALRGNRTHASIAQEFHISNSTVFAIRHTSKVQSEPASPARGCDLLTAAKSLRDTLLNTAADVEAAIPHIEALGVLEMALGKLVEAKHEGERLGREVADLKARLYERLLPVHSGR